MAEKNQRLGSPSEDVDKLKEKTEEQEEEKDEDLKLVINESDTEEDEAKKKAKPKRKPSPEKKELPSSEEPMFVDPRLPKGWYRKVIQRQGGATAGKWDVYIHSPEGKKFRSRNELRAFFDTSGSDLAADDFDFSVTGKGAATRKAGRKPEKEQPHAGLKVKLPLRTARSAAAEANSDSAKDSGEPVRKKGKKARARRRK